MADPFSITASAIGIAAFAQQLAQSVFKIKRFCEDVKNAPEELLDTLDDIENISRIMARVGHEQQALQNLAQQQGQETLIASLHRCQKAVGRVHALAQDLQTRMETRRKWVAMKAVVKKKDLETLLVKLDRAKTDLLLSYAVFAEAKRAKDAERVIELVEKRWYGHIQAVVDGDDASDGTELVKPPQTRSITNRAITKHMNSTRTWKMSLGLPSRLCQYAVNVLFVASSGRWTTSLHVCRVLPYDPDIHWICYIGDVQAIASLLQDRQISIHDRFYHEGLDRAQSLFHMAADMGQTDLARYLLEHGAERDYNPVGRRLQNMFSFFICQDLESCREHAEFLLSESSVDDDEAIILLDALAKPPSRRTCVDRLRVMATSGRFLNHRSLMDLCGDGEIDNELFSTNLAARGEIATVFHVIAVHLNWRDYMRRRLPTWQRTMSSLLQLVGRGVKAGADLSTKNHKNLTPFGTLINENLKRGPWNPGIMHTWVDYLAKLGVDLLQYGEVEQRTLCSRHNMYDRSASAFIGLNYGSRVNDWIVWTRHPGDVFAGVFWKLIECPEAGMPGAWLESDLVTAWDVEQRAKEHI